MTSTLSFRVEDHIIDALEDAAAQSRISRSQLAREALLAGLESLEGTDGLEVPEHLAHDAKIRRLIADNKRTRRKGKFRSEFAKQMKRSFKNNEHPEEFAKSVAGYREEAEDMGELPEPIQHETGCTTFEDWVEDKLEYYQAAYRASSWEAEPIENPLADFAGVENAREWVQRAEAIAAADSRADRLRRARLAQSDGVVPEELEDQNEIINAAVEIADSGRQLEAGNAEGDRCD